MTIWSTTKHSLHLRLLHRTTVALGATTIPNAISPPTPRSGTTTMQGSQIIIQTQMMNLLSEVPIGARDYDSGATSPEQREQMPQAGGSVVLSTRKCRLLLIKAADFRLETSGSGRRLRCSTSIPMRANLLVVRSTTAPSRTKSTVLVAMTKTLSAS